MLVIRFEQNSTDTLLTKTLMYVYSGIVGRLYQLDTEQLGKRYLSYQRILMPT
jgi:hypothetical protein